MKEDFYKYCLLKYRHTLLDESINIGLLIYFSNTKRFVFHYSKNLSRIKLIYDHVPEKTIRHYLKQIHKASEQLHIINDLFLEESVEKLDQLISNHLLPKDGSVLQFSNCLINRQRGFDNKIIEDVLLKKHLIKDISHSSTKSKEPLILKKFISYFDKINIDEINKKKKLFYTDYTISNETGHEFKFDYAWQNGTLNLVKPVSFDLKDAKNIADKAYRNLGQFYDLQNEAQEKGLRYDLLVAKPEDKKLYKEYDHAIALLETLGNTSIIEEEKIGSYSAKAIKAITEKQL